MKLYNILLYILRIPPYKWNGFSVWIQAVNKLFLIADWGKQFSIMDPNLFTLYKSTPQVDFWVLYLTHERKKLSSL
jgi:hypothetical protein